MVGANHTPLGPKVIVLTILAINAEEIWKAGRAVRSLRPENSQ